jgi:hypothetical protein
LRITDLFRRESDGWVRFPHARRCVRRPSWPRRGPSSASQRAIDADLVAVWALLLRLPGAPRARYCVEANRSVLVPARGLLAFFLRPGSLGSGIRRHLLVMATLHSSRTSNNRA